MVEVAQLANVGMRFGNRRQVLDGVDLTVRDGECVCLRGPNGAGKTTLLRILAALEMRYQGVALVDGVPPDRAREIVAYVPPFDLVWGAMTAVGQVKQLLNLSGLSDAWPPGVELAQVIARDFGDLRGFWLSSGQRRLLTVASALLLPARLVLLDEPLNSLDDARSEVVEAAIEAALLEGAGVLVASHDAIAPASRVAMLEGGRIVT